MYNNRLCSFEEPFRKFSRHSNPELNGKFITLSQSDEWMSICGVFNQYITPIDTCNHFNMMGELVNLVGYNWFLQNLASEKKVDLDELKRQMANVNSFKFLDSFIREN